MRMTTLQAWERAQCKMAMGRSVSMGALINEGILAPGEKLLTFDYMGNHYSADLLPDGLISWNGTIFSSLYSWASKCKNLTNPDHKSGIGWGHIRYKGIKLSQFKNVYLKKHSLPTTATDQDRDSETLAGIPSSNASGQTQQPKRRKRKQLLSNGQEDLQEGLNEATTSSELPGQSLQLQPSSVQDATTVIESQVSSDLLECTAFDNLGLQQPFSVHISSNVLLLMDFHSHLCSGEVAGYLGGHYDTNIKCLEVLQAFPCQCDLTSSEQGAQAEKKIQSSMVSKGLDVVGWYHSHPISEPKPSQSDVLSQRTYQESIRRDSGHEPCVGLIISPNHGGMLPETKSEFGAFWVLTIQQDGLKVSPMQLKYSVTWEQYLTQDVVDEMNALAAYYKSRPDYPNFKAVWKSGVTVMQKLKDSVAAVLPKFPQDNADETFMSYIEQLVLQ